MKTYVDPFDYAKEIMKALHGGVLLSVGDGQTVNTMTIGWGALAEEWYQPIFIAYVRDCRYTADFLQKTGEFTVNIPLNVDAKKILGYCGSRSGRDTDKFRDLGLTLVEGECVKAPAIRELPLTLECKVIYVKEQPIADIEPASRARFYSGKDEGNFHRAYYGRIEKAYILE